MPKSPVPAFLVVRIKLCPDCFDGPYRLPVLHTISPDMPVFYANYQTVTNRTFDIPSAFNRLKNHYDGTFFANP
jgi:hypothetical protein